MSNRLSIDIGRDDPTGFCVTTDDTIVYLGTDVNEIRKYSYDEVLVSEPISQNELIAILTPNKESL